jgi:predicted nucleic acid-binding protein
VSVLVDTSVIVDHLRADRRASDLLETLFRDEDRVWAAVPTRTEVLAGMPPREREAMASLFELMAWVEIDVALADAAGELARRYRASHGGIDTTDYLIAAAARSVGARLITLNVKHFPMFPDLDRPY